MNAVDIGFLVVLLASGVFALLRGFVYEILAVAGWVAAFLATFWGEPQIRPFFLRHISSTTGAMIAGGAVIFLSVLVVSSFITHAIARTVRKTSISAVDRSLGFGFGLVRGVLAASLAFIVVHKVTEPDEPAVLAQARVRPLLVYGAHVIEMIVPNHIADIQDKAKAVIDQATEAQQTKEMFDKLAAPKPKSSDSSEDKAPDAAGLDRLIENTNRK